MVFTDVFQLITAFLLDSKLKRWVPNVHLRLQSSEMLGLELSYLFEPGRNADDIAGNNFVVDRRCVIRGRGAMRYWQRTTEKGYVGRSPGSAVRAVRAAVAAEVLLPTAIAGAAGAAARRSSFRRALGRTACPVRGAAGWTVFCLAAAVRPLSSRLRYI